MVLSPSQETARVGNRTICLDLRPWERPTAWQRSLSWQPAPGQNAMLEEDSQTWSPAAVRWSISSPSTDQKDMSNEISKTMNPNNLTLYLIDVYYVFSSFTGLFSDLKPGILGTCQGSTLDLFVAPMVYLPARRLFQFLIQGGESMVTVPSQHVLTCLGHLLLPGYNARNPPINASVNM